MFENNEETKRMAKDALSSSISDIETDKFIVDEIEYETPIVPNPYQTIGDFQSWIHSGVKIFRVKGRFQNG